MEDFSNIKVNITFNVGPKIEIFDDHSPVYLIEYYEWFNNDWALIYSNHSIKPFNWFKHNKAFRTKWRIKIWGLNNDLPILLTQHTYDEKDKNILLRFDYPSYNVQKIWFEKSIKFTKDTGCNVYVESKYAEQLKKDYNSEVVLMNKISNYNLFLKINEIYATYEIQRHEIQSSSFDWWESDGIFENHADHYKSHYHPNDWIKLSNDELIDDILKL